MHLWSWHDRHNRDIAHIVNTLQLLSLNGLLNSLDHWGNLSRRFNKNVTDLVSQLQRRNLHRFLHCLGHEYVSLHTNEHVTSLVQELRLWELNGLGHLVHLLLDDGLLSLYRQLDDFRLLHFNCVDDVLNVRVDKLLCLFLRPNNRHLNDLHSG